MVAILQIAYAAAAGLASWLVFHTHSIRGDHAALAHVAAYMFLYTLSRDSSAFVPNAFFSTALLFVVYAAVALFITAVYRLSPWHPLRGYPGPWYARISSLWLMYISFTGKRYIILDELHTRYGAYVCIGPQHLSINSASGTSIYQSMEKADSYRFPKNDGAVALFFKQEPDAHRARRRVWAPLFTTSGLSTVNPQMERRTWELMRLLERRQSEKGGYVDISEAMYYWGYDFMGDMVYGGCIKFENMEKGDTTNMIHINKVATGLLDSVGQTPWFMDIFWHIPLTREMHHLAKHTAYMTKTRMNMKTSEIPHGFKDLAYYLLQTGISEKDFDADAAVAMSGGSDNTASTIALAIYFLLSNPSYYSQLQKELDNAFPNPLGPLPMPALAPLPLLNGVINETLRLASPYYVPRVVPPGGSHLDGHYLPEGTVVALAAHSQQTSAENFSPYPMDWRPERWQPDGLGPDTHTNKHMLASFSYGTHACIGKAMAYQQMRLVLARLILTFDMALPEEFDVAGFRAGIRNMRTTFLERDLLIKVTRRSGISSLSGEEGSYE